MREILFRGKRVDSGEWVEGYYLCQKNNYIGTKHYIYVFGDKEYNEYCDEDSRYEVDPATVDEYTGLQDKNGNKIFEGDIVKIPTESPMIAKVICPIGDGVLYEIIKADDRIYHKLRLRSSDFNVSEYEFYEKCIEVIGNIFDNTELLEEE